MRARLLFTAIFALLCLPLFFMQANDQQLRAQAVQVNLKEIDLPEDGLLIVHWPSSADEVAAHRDALRTAARISQDVEIPYQADTQHFLIRISAKKESLRVDVRFTPSFLELWTAEDPSSPAFRTRLGDRLALLPPLLAILLAFLTRKTILSLTCGVLLGVGIAITGNGGFAEFFSMLFHDILWKQILSSSFHLYILGFVILLSSTVAVITRMGGIDGMVHRLLHFARNSRSVQAVAYFLGLGIFFDDYANTIVVGNSCGPLFDKQKISRAKLAYIVDSTAAPVAGVAVLSTWVAYQISTYAPQLPTVGMDESRGYNLFLETIPYRFYCLFALMMVGIVIWMQRDFGPMLRAERAMVDSDDGKVDDTAIDDKRIEAKPGVVARARNGVLPLFVMIFGTAFLIYLYGVQEVNAKIAAGDLIAKHAKDTGGFLWFREVLGASESTKAIFMGSLAAMILATILAVSQRLLSAKEVAVTASGGIKVLFKDAVLVLILAWTIGMVCGEVGTANYLVALFQDLMSAQWLPIILFVAACFIAFATGSSWTTMAILQPNVVLLAYQLGEQTTMGGEALLILSIGAVLEGAIFGDHCSPISDTTVLSSTASRCRHIEHVRTQAPYALATAFVAICAAYLPVALWGANPYACLAVGAILLVLIVRFVGKSPRGATAIGSTS